MGKLQLCWTGEFEDLKEFVSENIELNAVWKSPGGDKKTFSDGHTTISWRKSKNVLQIEGKDENTIKAKLCSVLCGFVAASAGSGNSSSTLSELSTDVEGIKLDATIFEKDIQSNRLAIKNVEDSVNQVSENYREICNKLDNCMKEIHLLHNNKHMAQSVQTSEYSNLVDKDPFQQEIHRYDTATNTKELSHLTANDLTNTTNVSKIYNEIENLKESQSINSELVQTLFRHDVIDLSNITMRNRKQSKQSLEKLIPIVPYNDTENKACDPAGEVSTDYELPLIVNDQHLNISTQNSTLIRHETKESGSRTNPIQKEQSCHYNVPGRQSCSSYLHDRGQQFQSIPVRITHRPLPVNPEKVNKHRRAYRSQVFRHRHQTDWLRHLELVRKITRSQTVSILT